jgi:uncharacterized low-complexity protein
MSDNTHKRNLVSAIGAALAGSMILTAQAQNFEQSFSVKQLEGGYMQLAMKEGACGGNKAKEGSCGGDKAGSSEGKCGEGKCGGDKASSAEGKCGEGKCGGDKASSTEGKCGEGKCGASK